MANETDAEKATRLEKGKATAEKERDDLRATFLMYADRALAERAKLIVHVVAGKLASNTFDWNDVKDLVDAVFLAAAQPKAVKP